MEKNKFGEVNVTESPNIDNSWDQDWEDRMEGSIRGKNKSLVMKQKTEYIDPTVAR